VPRAVGSAAATGHEPLHLPAPTSSSFSSCSPSFDLLASSLPSSDSPLSHSTAALPGSTQPDASHATSEQVSPVVSAALLMPQPRKRGRPPVLPVSSKRSRMLATPVVVSRHARGGSASVQQSAQQSAHDEVAAARASVALSAATSDVATSATTARVVASTTIASAPATTSGGGGAGGEPTMPVVAVPVTTSSITCVADTPTASWTPPLSAAHPRSTAAFRLWLEALDLGCYFDAFVREGFDKLHYNLLSTLNDDEMRTLLGIEKVGHRRLLLSEIHLLQH